VMVEFCHPHTPLYLVNMDVRSQDIQCVTLSHLLPMAFDPHTAGLLKTQAR
jgi:cytidine deaminase